MKMKIKHTRVISWVNRKQNLSQEDAKKGCSDGLAPWTRGVATPLFGWSPAPLADQNGQKSKKSHLVQGELFPDQLADGSLKKPQPVALLEA